MLGFLRNSFSSLISFILVPTIVALVFTLSITSVFLNKEAFISILKSNNTFTRVGQEIIPPLIVESGAQEDGQTFIPKEVLISIIKNLDKSQLSKDLELLVSDSHDYLTGKQESFSTKIAVEPYVTSLTENLTPEFKRYIDSLPLCDNAQEQRLSLKENSPLTCKPVGKTSEQLLQESQVSKITTELSKNSPKSLVITESEIKTDPEIIKLDQIEQHTKKSVLQNLRKVLEDLNSIIGLLTVVTILLSILLFLSRLPRVDSSFKWSSSTLFSASILPFAFGLIFLIFVKPEMLQNSFGSLISFEQNSDLSRSISSLAADNLGSFLNKISLALIINSTILIVISIVFFFLHLFLQNKTKISAKSSIDSEKQ